MTHSHKFGFLKPDFCCSIVVMNGLLWVPPLVNVSNLVLWMKEEKQTCPDSESLLSSLFRSKKNSLQTEGYNECLWPQPDMCVCVCVRRAACVSRHTHIHGVEFTGLSGCVLVFVCWNVTLDSLRKSSGPGQSVVQDDVNGVFLLNSLDRSVFSSADREM